MRRTAPRGALLVAALASSLPLAASGGDDARLAASRAAVDSFQQRLRAELGAAMTQGGPVAAIEVCQRRAPAIAAELGTQTGATLGRTALRVRNPANAADAWQRQTLEDFAQRLQSGAPATGIERFDIGEDGGAHYARAIVTETPCLACHGTHLPPAVREALALRYPQDEATGFAAGELRGAFIVDWPAAAAAVKD